MENFLKRQFIVLTSDCDAEGRLGVRNIFDRCMDLASEHAAHLGVSYYDMLEYRCFWIAVRTRIRFYDRPRLADAVESMTWPGKPGLAKCDRYYRLSSGGKPFAEGRTEWAAQDLDTGLVRRTTSFGYPVDMEPREERVCAEPFTRFKDFEPAPEKLVRRYTVDPMDIDLGRHMNNVAYVRMLLGCFSTSEQADMDIAEFEISYRLACREGEELFLYRETRDDGLYFQVQKSTGETAVHARILFR